MEGERVKEGRQKGRNERHTWKERERGERKEREERGEARLTVEEMKRTEEKGIDGREGKKWRE